MLDFSSLLLNFATHFSDLPIRDLFFIFKGQEAADARDF